MNRRVTLWLLVTKALNQAKRQWRKKLALLLTRPLVPLPPEANFYVPTSDPPPPPALPASPTADGLVIDLCYLPPPLTLDGDTIGRPFDTKKPTCSISLLCNRNGFLQKYQVHVISKDRCAGPDQFDSLVARNMRLIKTDFQLFKTLKRTYEREMCDIWRKSFSLKALREIRLVSVCSTFPHDKHYILTRFESLRPLIIVLWQPFSPSISSRIFFSRIKILKSFAQLTSGSNGFTI